MKFSNDMLAELETPTRIFRTNIEKCVSPIKQRSQDPFLQNLFLSKREVLDFDDLPLFPTSIKNAFSSEEIPVSQPYIEKTVVTETRESSKQVDGPSPLQLKDNATPLPIKFKPTTILTDKGRPSEILSPAKITEHNFLSEDEDLKKIATTIISPKNHSLNISRNGVNDLPDMDNSANKYQKCIQQRKTIGIIDKGLKRKKSIMYTSERNQLKTRAMRVAAFWKGENSFIPSVFRVICLQREPLKMLIEFQDFSLKGLCHINENFDDEIYETKLSNHLDRLGDENLYKVYETLEERHTL